MQTANTSLGKRRRVLSLSAVGFCARTWTIIKQQTQADSLGSLRLSGVPEALSLQSVKDDQFFSPRSQSRSQMVVPLRCPFVCCSNAAATTPHDFDEFSWLADKTNSLPISDRQKKNFTSLLMNPLLFCLVPSSQK